MRLKQQKSYFLITGVAVGVAYGILTRFVFDEAIASFTYLIAVPVILGIIPFLFVHKEQADAYKYLIYIPWITIITFFFTMWVLGVEDILCLMVLIAPFIILGTVGAFLYKLYDIYHEKNKNKLLAIVVLPFIIGPVEAYITSPSESFITKNEVIIAAPANEIWNNIVKVSPISESEYKPGVLNSLGIPRPLNATVTTKAVGGIRTGNFKGGLQFKEVITDYKENEKISFSISVAHIPKSKGIFEQHVLRGNYFKFEEATYSLTPMSNGAVKLSLTSTYRLTSKVNFYGKLWSDLIIHDFQKRLLNVINDRCSR